MKKNILSIIFICSLLFTGCEYDNFDEPKSTLSGKVVYGSEPVGVRATGIELELWQDGFGLKKSIPIYIAHDGSYSAVLFNGEYKLVRKAGAPWQPQLNDTIIVNVKGNTTLDVPVMPYFIINNESFQGTSSNIAAKFTINKIVESSEISEVKVYLGTGILTDENKKEHAVSVDLANIEVGQETSLSINIPENLASENYLFVRVGVKSNISNEFYYTQVQKVEF
ncbi:MAG: DUF3823 domain-containing protein [Dysgonomonas sp.]|nr:DUF3823 domain-containing protein [Dysgonomonas sp.]